MQSETTTYDPMKILETPVNYKFALVILNRPILLRHDYVLPMWEKAQITVTVDGGTDKWLDYLGEKANDVLSGKCKKYLPTLVTGDMDSISPDLLNKLQQNTVSKVIKTPDVMKTDFTKALRQLKNYSNDNDINLNGIHVLAETGGRFDQIIASVNTLYKSEKILKDLWVILIASNSLTWLLKKGSQKIIVPKILLEKKTWCALIPFGNSSNRISTTGLKYNLNNDCMKFGDLISTSNTYSDQSEVTITTDVSLIWSMGIEPFTGVTEI